MSDEPNADDLFAEEKPDLPILFAAHNGLMNLTDETAQFVERSYLIPASLLPTIYELLDQYQVGADNFIEVPMGGRPDGL